MKTFMYKKIDSSYVHLDTSRSRSTVNIYEWKQGNFWPVRHICHQNKNRGWLSLKSLGVKHNSLFLSTVHILSVDPTSTTESYNYCVTI